MRAFRRYSTDILINVLDKGTAVESSSPLYNVSYGGLACHSEVAFESGKLVTVCILYVEPSFEADGVVVWCDSKDHGYELGIQGQNGSAGMPDRAV